MITALKVLFDPTGMKNKVLGEMVAPFSYTKRIPNTDYLNLRKQEWKHPAAPKEKSTESFLDIFKRAEKEGVMIFKVMEQYLQGTVPIDNVKTLIGNLSYETGKPCDSGLENLHFGPIL
ncbi:hypothetical protein [Tepidibacillus marianensis]|uniref:hypothetical protein n=1 Tax=Tepidibacillus marianensis TaxID=3131995 RepID=UPI0030CCD1CC